MFVFVPDYGPAGAWVTSEGEIVVDIVEGDVVVAGFRPDLVPQPDENLRRGSSFLQDVEPMAPRTVLRLLSETLSRVRAVPEEAAVTESAAYRLRRRSDPPRQPLEHPAEIGHGR